ncbi:MAG: hypothetical protein QNI87_04935 [Erythrobacter sp.]|uniref:hypothetical protein n=1 Tax=Erythrobacter sp. TaxID=1042 RepID=UPI00261228B3|nr:hypothetical protein [Erythrobacter sp.]MDJ0977861.1 hypothetical protein [Erythrobacter sp.]
MELRSWTPYHSSLSEGPEELALAIDRDRGKRLLVVPALFDEANKMRRFTLGVMRALDEAGIDTLLPDWPGCNESLSHLADQTLECWRSCADQAARGFCATHVLTMRAGALLSPATLPGWRYAATSGRKQLAGLLRAQVIAEREAGRNRTREELLSQGRQSGLMLGGWDIGAEMLKELETAEIPQIEGQSEVEQRRLGGAGLWLRAQPDDDPAQALALASIVAAEIAGQAEPAP